MNTPDGRVEAVLEGEKEKVEDMIRWCHQGSPHSRITEVSVDWEEYSGEFKDFSVRYSYLDVFGRDKVPPLHSSSALVPSLDSGQSLPSAFRNAEFLL